MPTGYTAKLCKEDQSFEEFALECARAFGATVTMRDEHTGVDIPEFEPTTYHAEELQKAIAKKAEILQMTDDQCHEMAIADYEKERNSCESCIKKCEEIKARLTGMLKRVEQWESPSSDHVEYREFMLDQLRQTINFDGDAKYHRERLASLKQPSGNGWRNTSLEKADWNIEYHTKENEKEISRVAERNNWVRQLRESLKPERV